jgi:hypothetical protein
MSYLKTILMGSSVLLLHGCISSFDAVKVPRSSENLKIARECQNTFAVATGYDRDGYQKLKMKCFMTFDGTTVETFPVKPSSVPNCELFDEADSGGVGKLYYLCNSSK